jgi:hypothetical protein
LPAKKASKIATSPATKHFGAASSAKRKAPAVAIDDSDMYVSFHFYWFALFIYVAFMFSYCSVNLSIPQRRLSKRKRQTAPLLRQ